MMSQRRNGTSLSGAAAATALVASLGGCLMFERVQEVEQAPLSPTVGRCCLDPLIETRITVDQGDTTPLTFTITVIEDANVDDTLRVRWFLDGYYVPIDERIIEPAEDVDARSVERRVPVTLALPLDLFNRTLDPIHRVEVIISDGLFRDDIMGGDVTESRDVEEGANAHYLYWEVEFL